MWFLVLGQTATGLVLRIVLLSHRGGFYLEDQARRSNIAVFLDFLFVLLSFGTFFLGFFLFDWWVPIVGLVAGTILAPNIMINGEKLFWAFYPLRTLITLFGIVCYLIVWVFYLG